LRAAVEVAAAAAATVTAVSGEIGLRGIHILMSEMLMAFAQGLKTPAAIVPPVLKGLHIHFL